MLILVVSEHTLKSKNLHQGLKNIFCKESDSNCFRFATPYHLYHINSVFVGQN